MNRKLRKGIFLSLLTSFTLFSCETNYREQTFGTKIPTRKVEGIDSYVLIETDKELNDIARYESAMIMIGHSGCSYCVAEMKKLKPFIQKTETLVYVVSPTVYYNVYNSSENKTGTYANLYPQIAGTPTYLFYYGGTLVNIRSGAFADLEKNLTEEYLYDFNYYSLNTFTAHGTNSDSAPFDRYYTMDIDEETDTLGYDYTLLSEAIKEKKTVVYTWRRCSDCTSLHEEILDSYLKSNTSIKIYYYEVDGYYQLKRSSDEEEKARGENLWAAFCSQFFLIDYEDIYDSQHNSTGVVPTLITYDDSSHTTAVFRNDQDPYVNSEGRVQYATAYYEDVKNLTSDTKVSQGDTTSATFQKALLELSNKALEVETKLVTKYLKDNLE